MRQETKLDGDCLTPCRKLHGIRPFLSMTPCIATRLHGVLHGLHGVTTETLTHMCNLPKQVRDELAFGNDAGELGASPK